jgi:hypothetical protein
LDQRYTLVQIVPFNDLDVYEYRSGSGSAAGAR